MGHGKSRAIDRRQFVQASSVAAAALALGCDGMRFVTPRRRDGRHDNSICRRNLPGHGTRQEERHHRRGRLLRHCHRQRPASSITEKPSASPRQRLKRSLRSS